LLSLGAHAEGLVKAVESLDSDVRISSCANAAVEVEASISGTVVHVGHVGRGHELTDDGQGLPEIDVGCIDGTTSNLKELARICIISLFAYYLGIISVNHLGWIELKQTTLNHELLSMQLDRLLLAKFVDYLADVC